MHAATAACLFYAVLLDAADGQGAVSCNEIVTLANCKLVAEMFAELHNFLSVLQRTIVPS
jgi:hypothetical protein